MKQLLLILLMLPAMISYSQLVSEDSASAEGDADEKTIGHTFTVTNSGADTEVFYWDIVRPDEVPDEWVFTVCDANVCWPEDVEVLDCSAPNQIDAGVAISYFKVSLNPNLAPGKHTIDYRLLKSCSDAVPDEDVILVVSITFEVGETSDIESISTDSQLVLYPNPTTDRFQIEGDADISNITLYNIVGKQVMQDNHTYGQSHDITQLDNGMYLVRMMNSSNEVIKILRMTKE